MKGCGTKLITDDASLRELQNAHRVVLLLLQTSCIVRERPEGKMSEYIVYQTRTSASSRTCNTFVAQSERATRDRRHPQCWNLTYYLAQTVAQTCGVDQISVPP